MDFTEAQLMVKQIKAEYGIQLPAVTQVLTKTKIPFDTWMAKLEAGIDIAAERDRLMKTNKHIKAATSRGRKVAKAIENADKDHEDPLIDAVLKRMKKCMRGYKVKHREATVSYDQLFWGRVDLIGQYKGEMVIADNKSVNNPLPRYRRGDNVGDVAERAYKDYAMQLAAYTAAYNKMFDTNLDRGLLFFVEGKEIDALEHTVVEVNTNDYFDQFMERLDDYNRREKIMLERKLQYYA